MRPVIVLYDLNSSAISAFCGLVAGVDAQAEPPTATIAVTTIAAGMPNPHRRADLVVLLPPSITPSPCLPEAATAQTAPTNHSVPSPLAAMNVRPSCLRTTTDLGTAPRHITAAGELKPNSGPGKNSQASSPLRKP